MAASAPTLRVVHDPPQAGAVNMATDEALLGRVGRGDSPPTLRLYQWTPPTISLGYFQKYTDYELLPPPAGELAVVRRQTGGGAILHDRELTYSLALPLGHFLLDGGPNELYAQAHDVVIACLARMGIEAWRGCETDASTAARGPFFCFARRHCYDVLIGDDKVAGSAQRRTRDALLQHGSIVCQRQFEQQPAATTEFEPGQIAELFKTNFASVTDCQLVDGAWTAAEREVARDLVAKHNSREWLERL